MMAFDIGQQLPPYEVVAHNYAADAANKIHSDEGAAEHGFAGALVPGVAIYAYLTHPVIDALGQKWIDHGTMSGKFLKPIYDKEKVCVQARVTCLEPITLNLELLNPSGVLCAVGSAGLTSILPALWASDYPYRAIDRLRPATIAAIGAGEIFGTLEFKLDFEGDVAEFFDKIRESRPFYPACHPAWWIAQANEVIMQNIALGMWIHTASETRHYAQARDGERITMRSRVTEAVEKRGHELITLDIGVFGEHDRPIAHITHSAIIRLKAG